MSIKSTLLASAVILSPLAVSAQDMTIGFSQIGSESGWRAAETTLTKQQAEEVFKAFERLLESGELPGGE